MTTLCRVEIDTRPNELPSSEGKIRHKLYQTEIHLLAELSTGNAY